jgi:hypothetical protein
VCLRGDILQNALDAYGVAMPCTGDAILARLEGIAASENGGCNYEQTELDSHRPNENKISHRRVLQQLR